MFDVGGGEFLGLAVVALIVLGPDKLPRFAADAARFVHQVRKMATDAREDVRRELGPELQDISLADLNPRTLVRKHVLDGLDLDGPIDDDPPSRRRSGNADAEPHQGSADSGGPPPPPYDADAT
jgi:sec-independent protein translocase protein TatB